MGNPESISSCNCHHVRLLLRSAQCYKIYWGEVHIVTKFIVEKCILLRNFHKSVVQDTCPRHFWRWSVWNNITTHHSYWFFPPLWWLDKINIYAFTLAARIDFLPHVNSTNNFENCNSSILQQATLLIWRTYWALPQLTFDLFLLYLTDTICICICLCIFLCTNTRNNNAKPHGNCSSVQCHTSNSGFNVSLIVK